MGFYQNIKMQIAKKNEEIWHALPIYDLISVGRIGIYAWIRCFTFKLE